MKKLFLFACFLISIQLAFAQNWKRCMISTDPDGWVKLQQMGLALDHGIIKPGYRFTGDFSVGDIERLKKEGFEIEILIHDLEKWYGSQNQMLRDGPLCQTAEAVFVPEHFKLGSMGGYYTYQEYLDELDAMAAAFPNLISLKTPIDTFSTHQGRPLYYIRISDNANIDENEPEILYTAVHHAREPLSLSQTIYYMWYLLEKYDSDQSIAYLINETELYFVPMVNPDGYIYNEQTNPAGGGMWRKNRRINSNGTYGVDLNRNYSNAWGTTGINTSPDSDIYPGTGPFSEPETKAIKWLCEQHRFYFSFNAHTFGNLILFPIGSMDNLFADDHDYFNSLGQHMALNSPFVAQKASELYPASGTSDDYMYLEDLGVKPKIFAYTPEIGTDEEGFWPPAQSILPGSQTMIKPNLALARSAHNYWQVNETDPSRIMSNSGYFHFDALRLGLDDTDLRVSLIPLQGFQSFGSDLYIDLPLNGTKSDSIAYVLNPNLEMNALLRYVIVSDFGAWQLYDTITKHYGLPLLQVFDEANSQAGWTGNWALTNEYFYSANQSFTDSPNTDYTNNSTKTWTYNSSIDLRLSSNAQVSFYARWMIENNYDYARFEVSTDGGTSWIGQCGKYTNAGNNANGSVQPYNEPVYDGTQNNWVLEEISLNAYLGQEIMMRFIMKSDGGITSDGFYFDDFQIRFDSQVDPEPTPVLQFFPNPANQSISITGLNPEQQFRIRMFDQSGRVVLNNFLRVEQDTYKVQQPIGQLQVGSYWCEIIADDHVVLRAPIQIIR